MRRTRSGIISEAYYTLLKGAPGGDRPLVYSRLGVPAGGKPAYPTNEPQFGYYGGPVRGTPAPGQFRDVSRWPATWGQPGGLVLKPLE
jgi:hypothetical protein